MSDGRVGFRDAALARGFTSIPNDVLVDTDLSVPARMTWMLLAKHAWQGDEAFPSQTTLADLLGVTDRSVRTYLTELVEHGWVEIRRRPNASSVYLLTVPDRKQVSTPDRKEASGPVRKLASYEERRSEEREKTTPTATSSLNARANGERPRIAGKPVNAEAWALTVLVLDAYNRVAGSRLRLLTSAGQPSEAAKRIYGRVRDYPDITLEKHERIIRNTLASRWWGDGPPTIGVVFGPRVFEENITRRAAGRNGTANQAAASIAAAMFGQTTEEQLKIVTGAMKSGARDEGSVREWLERWRPDVLA